MGLASGPTGPVCDFCHRPSPTWRFPCRSFVLESLPWRSTSDWLACQACYELVQAQRFSLLFEAVRQTSPYSKQLEYEEHRQLFMSVMSLFVANQLGSPQRELL